VDHRRQERVVRLALELFEHRRDGVVDLAARAVGDLLLGGVALEVRGARREFDEPSPQRRLLDEVEAERALQDPRRKRLRVLGDELGTPTPDERIDELVRGRRDDVVGIVADGTDAEPRVDDLANSVVVRALGREQVAAERSLQRGGLGFTREELGCLVDVLHIRPARDKPETD
jgi:hypothetical protein